MSLFKNTGYDRKRIFSEAERARAKGRAGKAAHLYRRILAVEPHDPELNARVAPMLAKLRQEFDAWQSYRRAGKALVRAKQLDEALVLYREATSYLPRQIGAWQAVAKLELRMGRRAAAREALLEGRRQLRRRSRRPEAIALLRSALELEPWEVDTMLDLCRLLAKTDQLAEGMWLLEQLAERSSGLELRRVRAALWRMEPSLRNTWNWGRCLTASAEGNARGEARPA